MRPRPHPDFSCFLIWKDVYEKVGSFDELPCGFYEDNMYHVRMHRRGVQALCIDVPFFHYSSATLKMADNNDKKAITEAAAQNRELFHKRYGCYPGTKEYEALFEYN
jgi:GT2 family glycosyltransferase